MRVSIDETLCAGTGQCEMLCPEVFEVDLVAHVRQPEPDPALHDEVRDAADNCPSAAILVED